jgi:dTDP-4-amino-4,6-dideoxy-D-galactose acyltransferase
MAQVSAEGLSGQAMGEVLVEASQLGYELLQASCRVDDERTMCLLEDHGFRIAGTRLCMAKSLRLMGNQTTIQLRRANKQDIPALLSQFSDIFKDSRFYQYPGFDAGRVSDMYSLWLEKGVLGQFDDECLLLENATGIQGFACLKYHGDHARIGLFGVLPSQRRQGHGLSLLAGLECSLLHKEIWAIKTATQAKNFAAIRLYEKAGFHTAAMEIYFVRHLP